MKKLILAAALGCFLCAPVIASPLFPVSALNAAATDDDIIQVKKSSKARPYGWSKGRKVGWRGGRVPPGHQKKRIR